MFWAGFGPQASLPNPNDTNHLAKLTKLVSRNNTKFNDDIIIVIEGYIIITKSHIQSEF